MPQLRESTQLTPETRLHKVACLLTRAVLLLRKRRTVLRVYDPKGLVESGANTLDPTSSLPQPEVE
jgi:hypothetical protein